MALYRRDKPLVTCRWKGSPGPGIASKRPLPAALRFVRRELRLAEHLPLALGKTGVCRTMFAGLGSSLDGSDW
jgi:hypothetical protein